MQPKKKITAEVSHEAWKALKILAVQKDISLQMVVADILERSTKSKVNKVLEVVDTAE